MTPRRKTKIVATLGPASTSIEMLEKMVIAGVDVVRFNFSHGSHEEHFERLVRIRSIAKNVGRPVAILQDLCGPKVRIGEVKDGTIFLEKDAIIVLRHIDGNKGDAKNLYVEAFNPVEVVAVGEKVLLADGRIMLEATEVRKDGVACRIISGGDLRSRSGIAVPESKLNLPCLTEKDLEDLKWGIANDMDFIALSFVMSEHDVFALRRELNAAGSKASIISKVERAAALDHISAIVEASDGIMVARGDLGLELPLEKVPSAQRLIIHSSNFAGKPVITATQMLMSMVKEIRPTRAEVTDVTTAVRDGTDAVMLSEESAIGAHPDIAIETLCKILIEAEKELIFEPKKPRQKGSDKEKVSDAICYAACNAAEKVECSAIVACTQSGVTARLISKYRPNQPLVGATANPSAIGRMALIWGVEPLLIELPDGANTEDEVNEAIKVVRDRFKLKPGSRIVVTAGLRTKQSGSTNLLEIREIPR